MQQIEVDIVGFTKKGNGFGYFERRDKTCWPVEVPFTIPGDRAKALLLRKKSGIYRSILDEIVISSKERTAAKCRHFGNCGGCRWQQMEYQKQIEEKNGLIHRYFSEFVDKSVRFFPIAASDSPWQYRNKMEFSFSSDRKGNHYLGLMLDQGKGRVLDVKECHLPNSWFVEALDAVRNWWNESDLEAYHCRKDLGSLRTLTLREGKRTGDRMVNLTVSGNPDYALKKHHLEGLTAFVRDAIEPVDPNQLLSIFLTIQQIKKGSPTQFYEMHLYGSDTIREILYIPVKDSQKKEPLTFYISPAAFFQPNTLQAEKLYALALDMADLSGSEVVYDLYCGTGTLGICAAKRAKEVVGVELSPESAHDARHNAKENGFQNITIITGSVKEVLQNLQLERGYPKPDVVLVDPPRAGLERPAIQQIIELNPSKLIYISCNPATQAENLGELLQNGYRLEAIQPVDQFPHTVHIENIALLKKTR